MTNGGWIKEGSASRDESDKARNRDNEWKVNGRRKIEGERVLVQPLTALLGHESVIRIPNIRINERRCV